MNDLTRYRLCAELKAPPSAKLIYCYLLDASDKGSITASMKNIAKAVGLSRSTACSSLHRLNRLDLLTITPRYTEDGGRLSHKYRVGGNI